MSYSLTIIFLIFFLSHPTLSFDLSSFASDQFSEVLGGAASDLLGYSVSSAGDINNDGFDDIIIGASAKDGKGAAYIIYGGSEINLSDFDFSSITLDPAKTGFIITGNAAGDCLGSSVSGAGDINKDGYDDVIVAAYCKNSYQGAVYVVYGGKTSSRRNIDLGVEALEPAKTGFMVTGNAASDRLGNSVSGAGDINNDGYDDIMIGAYRNQGTVYVIFGRKTSNFVNVDLANESLDPEKTGFVILGNLAGDYFGNSVSGAGDMNNDGYDDMIIGAPNKNTNTGKVYVVYGRKTFDNIDLSGETLDSVSTGFTLSGETIQNYFGYSVGSAGDINNDGFGDVIIGAHNRNSKTGAAYIVYGGKVGKNFDLSSENLEAPKAGFMVFGNAAGDRFGYSVKTAGDVNEDGYDDIVIGAPYKNSSQGAVYVVYGGSYLGDIDLGTKDLELGETGFVVMGNPSCSGFFGWSVGFAGDVDGDGYDDIVIGAKGENSNKGAAYIFYPERICAENCESCSYPSTCEICLEGYRLIDDSLCLKCPAGTFLSEENKSCLDCSEGCLKCSSETICQVCEAGFTLSETHTCLEQSQSSTQANVSMAIFDGTSMLGAALSSGSSLPLNFGLVAKILRNIKYLDIQVSSELQETFYTWKVTSSFLAAPKSWSEQAGGSRELPYVFSQYGLEPVFLINYWKSFLLTIIGGSLFVVFKLIEVKFYKDKKVSKMSKQVKIAASNFALTQFYSNLDDAVFYFVIELRSAEFEKGFRIFSCGLAVGILIVGAGILVCHVLFLKKYQRKKQEGASLLKEFKKRYENIKLIFKDFKDVDFLSQSFLWINLGRSLLCSLLFTVLFEYPMVQVCLLLLFNIGIILFLFKKKPFIECIDTCGQLFCEFVLLSANLCMFVMAILDQGDPTSDSELELLGKFVIILNLILLLGCAILLVVNMGKVLVKIYKERKKSLGKPNMVIKVNIIRETTGFPQAENLGNLADVENIREENLSHNGLKTTTLNFTTSRRLSSQNSSFHRQEPIEETRSNMILERGGIEDFGETSSGNLLSNSYFSTPKPLLRLKRGKVRVLERISSK